jgi:formylmethanofuran dehydrogenase subunit E
VLRLSHRAAAVLVLEAGLSGLICGGWAGASAALLAAERLSVQSASDLSIYASVACRSIEVDSSLLTNCAPFSKTASLQSAS